MSEQSEIPNEGTDTTRLEPTAQDPSEGPDPESNPTPAVDLSQTVKLPDGQEVKVGDLVREREQVEHLRKYRDMARSIVSSDGTMDENYEQAARFVLQDAGYEPEQIDAWIQFQRQQSEQDPSYFEGAEEPGVSYEDQFQMSDNNASEDPRDREIAALKAQLQEVQARVEGTDVRTLEERLTSKVDEATRNEKLTSLLQTLDGLGGDPESRKKFARDEIRRITLERIKRRKAGGGQFDPRWFDEETQKAAEDVAEKFRTVIGDPNLLRKAPETDAGQDILMPKGPVKEPNLPPTADISDRISEAQRYTTEKLLEQLRVGGDSKA